jgi:hypothetical protein
MAPFLKSCCDADSLRYMERWRKLHGRRLDHDERLRKKTAREGHKASDNAQKLTGLRAKLYQKKRHSEKIQMKKQIKAQYDLSSVDIQAFRGKLQY